MKNFSRLFLIAAAVFFFSTDLAAARKQTQSKRPRKTTVGSSGRLSARQQAASNNQLRKKENFALAEIQNAQKRLLKDRNKKNDKQKQACLDKISKRAQELGSVLHTPDFPFGKELNTIEQVVADIHAGKIQFSNMAGQSEEKILREIHKRQWKALGKFQQERSVIR